MDLSKLTQGEKIVLGAGVVLLIDLLFLPWHREKVELALNLSSTFSATAIESPNAFWGVVALLITGAMVAVVIAMRFTSAKLPDLPIPWGQAMFIAGVAVAALLLLKLVLETSALGIGAGLGILLGGAMAFGGFLIRNEPAAPPPASPGF